MIKAVFFDIDDTLYDSTELAARARMNAVNAMIDAGLPEKDPRKVMAILLDVIKECGSNYSKHYAVLLRRLGMKWNPEIIAAGVSAYHDTKPSYLKPFPDVVPTLLKLRKAGYKLGVISDGLAVKQWEKLIRMGLQHFFDTVVISETIHHTKPDPKLFKIALEGISCSPKESMMVGDSINRDIGGAKAAGMTTVWLKSSKKGRVKPNHTITNLRQLPSLLEKINGKNTA